MPTGSTTSSTSTSSTVATSTYRPPPVIYRPANLSRARPVPLDVALHGNGGNPVNFASSIGLQQAADRYGFVGASLGSSLPTWYAPSNITYISQEINQLIASENIDPKRVYVMGFSLGGYATYRTACQLSNQVAAIAVVSNIMAPLWRKPCNIARPLSELDIVGSNDLAPVKPIPSEPYVSADQTATSWRTLDGCTSRSQTTQVGPTVQTTWSQCNDRATVGEYIVQGGTHRWPGPGSVGADGQYDATTAILNFFFAHRAASLTNGGATLSSLRVTGGHSRTIRAVLSVATSSLMAQLMLTVRRRTVASRRLKLVRGPQGSISLRIPSRIKGGYDTVGLVLVDQYGRTLTIIRNVKIPSLPEPKPRKKG